jgi:hypothetical protein
MSMMNPQLNADLPVRRDVSDLQPQPQAEQGLASLQPDYRQHDEPVAAVAQGDDSDTFEVSMDDWFKA